MKLYVDQLAEETRRGRLAMESYEAVWGALGPRHQGDKLNLGNDLMQSRPRANITDVWLSTWLKGVLSLHLVLVQPDILMGIMDTPTKGMSTTIADHIIEEFDAAFRR